MTSFNTDSGIIHSQQPFQCPSFFICLTHSSSTSQCMKNGIKTISSSSARQLTSCQKTQTSWQQVFLGSSHWDLKDSLLNLATEIFWLCSMQMSVLERSLSALKFGHQISWSNLALIRRYYLPNWYFWLLSYTASPINLFSYKAQMKWL